MLKYKEMWFAFLHNRNIRWNWCSSVSIVTRLWTGRLTFGFLQEQGFFFSAACRLSVGRTQSAGRGLLLKV